MELAYCHYEEDGVSVCFTKTSSDSGYCQEHRFQRGRKVSTEGKAARGQTPDSGSTPDCSTDDPDAELMVAYEDMADRVEALERRSQMLEDELLQLRMMVIDLKQNPPYMYTMPGAQPYNGNITYTQDKNTNTYTVSDGRRSYVLDNNLSFDVDKSTVFKKLFGG